jgi:hypothetical protein
MPTRDSPRDLLQRAAAAQSQRLVAPDIVIPLIQGVYYAMTGVWSLVSLRTFERVTGPKVDGWLVKTVGVLVLVIGSALGMAGYARRVTPELALLAGGSAAGLAAIDSVYVARKRISPIYLLDAVAEVGLVGAWVYLWRQRWMPRTETPAPYAAQAEALHKED